MKLLWILPILFSLSAQAQKRCEDLFPVSNIGKIENFKKDVTAVYSYEKHMDLRRLQARFETLEPHEKTKAIQKFLVHNQVEFKVTSRWNWWPIPKRYEEIEILTSGTSEMNSLAKRISEKFKNRLVYSPEYLAELGANGVYSSYYSTIYLSEFMTMTDIPDLTFFHEVRHMIMHYREKKGDSSIVNGGARKNSFFRDKWPWGKVSKSNYKNYYSLQEAETWHQNFVYNLAHIRQLARDHKLNFSDLNKWIDEAKERNSLNMVEDTLALIEYELEVIPKKLPSITANLENKEIYFAKFGLFYKFGHTVPAKFIEQYMSQKEPGFQLTSESLERVIEQEDLSREIIISYLKDLREDLLSKKEYALQGLELLQEIQRQANYFEVLKQPIENLEELIAKLGKSNDWQTLSVSQVPSAQFTRLNIDGLDFSTVESSLYKKKVRKFKAEDPHLVYEYELKDFFNEAVVNSEGGAGYAKIELTYRHQGTTGTLILEGLPGLKLSRIGFNRLYQAGVEIVKAEVRVIHYSKIQNRKTSSLDLSYLKMPIEELAARNQYRLDSMLEQLRD